MKEHKLSSRDTGDSLVLGRRATRAAAHLCLGLALWGAAPLLLAAQRCDIDGDGAVDQADVRAIMDAAHSTPSPNDPRDANGDGVINVLDARVCALCSLGNCKIDSPPVAKAGTAPPAAYGATVTLDGSGSSDVDGDPLTYHWTWVSLPPGSNAAFSDPTAVRPTFVVDVSGNDAKYVAQLIVNDGMHDSAPTTVTITAGDTPPTANAGPDQTKQLNDTVMLDGSGSSDVDGDPLTFLWTLKVPDGSTATLSDPTAVRPTFVVDVTGEGVQYVAQLIVNDGIADSKPATVTINTINTPPVANAGNNQLVLVGALVQLDGSSSHDVDGDPITYRWALIGKPSCSQATLSSTTAVRPTFVADWPCQEYSQDYVAQLIVNDGIHDSAPSTVTISAINSPPEAKAGPDQIAQLNDTVMLDGSASSDVDGDPLTFHWSLVKVPAGSKATLSDPTAVRPTFVVDVTGENAQYVFQLIVNDGRFDSEPDTVTINTNTPPVADAGQGQLVPVGALVQLDGSRSYDVNGDTITFRWALISKPSCSQATLSSTTAVQPTFVATWPCQEYSQDYVAQLIVNDGIADSTPATVTITTNYNKPVAAICGPIPPAPLGTTVTLDGSCSTTTYGTLTYRWSLTPPSGATGTLSDPTIVNPSFTVEWADSAVNACYVAQLIVNDGISDSDPTTATICTQYQPPVAVLCCNQTVPVGTVVTLDASGSTSFNGHALVYGGWCVGYYDYAACTLPVWQADPTYTFTAVFPDLCPNGPYSQVDYAGSQYSVYVYVYDGISVVRSNSVAITTNATCGVLY